MFPYLRFHVLATPQAPGSGVPLAAPLLRRMLSRVLLETHCPFNVPGRSAVPPCQLKLDNVRRQPAERCRQAVSCPFGVLVARGLTGERVPFALHVEPAREDGVTLVELTLYARAWKLYPWALAALTRALADGLDGQRFRVERVLRSRATGPIPVADRGLRGLPSHLEPDLMSFEAPSSASPRRWTLDFLSPMRLEQSGRELRRGEEFGFELLLSRALDRFVGLYGDSAAAVLDADRRLELETAAARVRLVGEETHFVEVVDYSARRGKKHRLDGFVGRLTYEAPKPQVDFRPWLRAAEILHVGKRTAAGNGRMRYLAA